MADTRPIPPMQCLVCSKPLDPAFLDDATPRPPPSGATVFYSHGNYGSTAWDPGNDAQHLELFICDGCLVERAQRVLRVTPGPLRQDNKYTVWDPKKES